MFTCPVCGSAELASPPYAIWPPPTGVTITPPYEDFLGAPSYEVCPNCGFEFGFDDNPGANVRADSFNVYRRSWEQSGAVRFSKKSRADGASA